MTSEQQELHQAALRVAGFTGRRSAKVCPEKCRQTPAYYVLADANGIPLARVPLEPCQAMLARLQRQKARQAASIQPSQSEETVEAVPNSADANPIEGAAHTTGNTHSALPLPDLEQSNRDREFAMRLIPYSLLFAILIGFVSCARLGREPVTDRTIKCLDRRTGRTYQPVFGESCHVGKDHDFLMDKGLMDSFRMIPFRR
jgi:hypothetical protein